jgi:hypothetical protein
LTLLGLVVVWWLGSCAPALEVGRDHPAHPDAPAAHGTPRSALLSVDAGLDDVLATPDAGPAVPAHHHHHHGGSP